MAAAIDADIGAETAQTSQRQPLLIRVEFPRMKVQHGHAGGISLGGLSIVGGSFRSPSPLYSGERGWGEGACHGGRPDPHNPGPAPPRSGERGGEIPWARGRGNGGNHL